MNRTFEIINNLHEFNSLRQANPYWSIKKGIHRENPWRCPVTERLEGTAAAVAISIMNGANIIRAHDVKEMVKVAKVADAIKKEKIY